MIEGKVGNKKVYWQQTPKGKVGEGEVLLDGVLQKVRWIRDDQGIWIETPRGFVGYEVRKTISDEGAVQYTLFKQKHAEVVSGLSFLKVGEEQGASTSKVKKGRKIKSQMPGKILRVNVKAGDAVLKGQSLLVMEAMKMENEIKAIQEGVIKEVKVKEGQAVETGAELLSLE